MWFVNYFSTCKSQFIALLDLHRLGSLSTCPAILEVSLGQHLAVFLYTLVSLQNHQRSVMHSTVHLQSHQCIPRLTGSSWTQHGLALPSWAVTSHNRQYRFVRTLPLSPVSSLILMSSLHTFNSVLMSSAVPSHSHTQQCPHDLSCTLPNSAVFSSSFQHNLSTTTTTRPTNTTSNTSISAFISPATGNQPLQSPHLKYFSQVPGLSES